jgi:hypothetical protein
MSAGIHFANFAWEDMTTPPVPLLADIVRVLTSHLAVGGKVSHGADNTACIHKYTVYAYSVLVLSARV